MNRASETHGKISERHTHVIGIQEPEKRKKGARKKNGRNYASKCHIYSEKHKCID